MGKGEDFEREMCRELSLWWTVGARDDVFWRNRRHKTSKSPDMKHQLGDVTTVESIGIPLIEVFNIELKTGYSKQKKGKRIRNIPWDLLDVIDGRGKPVLLDFWIQTITDAQVSNRFPLLIFKRDYHKPVVVMYKECFLFFERYQGGFSGEWLQGRLRIEREIELLVFISWKQFSEWLQPHCVRLIHNKYKKVRWDDDKAIRS